MRQLEQEEGFLYDIELATTARKMYKKAPMIIVAKKMSMELDYVYYLITEYKRIRREQNVN